MSVVRGTPHLAATRTTASPVGKRYDDSFSNLTLELDASQQAERDRINALVQSEPPGGPLYTQPSAPEPEHKGFVTLSLKYRLQQEWAKGTLAQWWTMLVVLFSIVSAVVYVLETYLDRSSTPVWSYVVETVIAVFFSVDYAINLYLADRRLLFIAKLSSIVDLLCIVPVIFTYVLSDSEDRASQFVLFLQFLRVARLIRVLRGHRALVFSKRGDPECLKKQVNILIYTLVALIFITAALLHLVENYGHIDEIDDTNVPGTQIEKFHDAVYFVVITLTTVGYGDITPQTFIGRLLVMFFVTASVLIIPKETGRLHELMALTSQYAGKFVPQEETHARHVVVCGYIEYANLRSLLLEFFHDAHGQHQMTVVVLCHRPPSKSVKTLFGQNSMYDNRVQYFEGSVLEQEDLLRVQAETAFSVFVLTDKSSPDPESVDNETIMKVLSLRNACPGVPLFAQIRLADNKKHAAAAGAHYVICLNELKMNILSVSCLVTGFSTLFCNLFQNESFVHEEPNHWLTEYCHGISYEIYTLDFPSAFVGRSFAQVTYFIFEEWQSLLFGIQMIDKTTLQPTLLLNPSGSTPYIIGPEDRGFLFATDASVIEEIKLFTGDIVTTGQATGAEAFSAHGEANDHPKDAANPKRNIPESPKHDDGMPPLIPIVPPAYGSSREAVFLNGRLLRSVPATLRDHVVLITHDPTVLLRFIEPLRSNPAEANPVPIVTLMPQFPPKVCNDAIVRYPEVYLVIGTGREPVDFVRCGASRARCVVISSCDSEACCAVSCEEGEEDMMRDFETIAIHHCLHNISTSQPELFPMPFTLVELKNRQNHRYFPPYHDQAALGCVTERNHYIVPSYSAGKLFTEAVVDSLICQVFYNPDLLKVLHLLLERTNATQPAPTSPKHADNGPSGEKSHCFQSGILHMFPVPKEFVGITFGSLLRSFLLAGDSSILPFGIYRAAKGEDCHPSAPPAAHPYVFLCPLQETVLCAGDRLYVLSARDPAVIYAATKESLKKPSTAKRKVEKNPLSFPPDRRQSCSPDAFGPPRVLGDKS